MQIFKCKAYPEYEIVAYSYETSNSWGHKATLMHNGTTPQSIMESYCEDITLGWEYEDVCDEVLDITADIETMTDNQLCNTYDINKIGKYYFRGNW